MENDVRLGKEKVLKIKLPEICIPEKDAREYFSLINEFICVLKGKVIDDYFAGKAIYKYDYTYIDNEKEDVLGQAMGFSEIDELLKVETEIIDNYVEGGTISTYQFLQDAKKLLSKNVKEPAKEGKSSVKK